MIAAHVTRYPTGDIELRFPFDRSFIEVLKVRIPARHRAWDPTAKVWCIDPSYASVAIRLLGDWCESVVVEDAEDWADASTSPPPPQPIRQIDRAYAALHLQPTAPAELVESAYRCLARLHHPDTGGDHSGMVRINEAISALREQQGMAS